MSYYEKKKLLSALQQQAEEYENPETDPREPLYGKIEVLEDMDETELIENFGEDEDCGDAVKETVLEALKKASAPQDEIDRVDSMNHHEVLSEFGEANAETIRKTAINALKNKIYTMDKNHDYLLEEIEDVKKTPARYYN